jgi:hypothetical protein
MRKKKIEVKESRGITFSPFLPPSLPPSLLFLSFLPSFLPSFLRPSLLLFLV